MKFTFVSLEVPGKSLNRFWATAVVVGACVAMGSPARALPMFARKYSMQCQQCHTIPPRLTPMGYRFLRAGYRLSQNEEQTHTFANTVAFLTEFHAQSTGPDGDRGFDMGGAEIQAATSVGNNLATRIIYEFPPDGPATFDETWVQYNSAATGSFFTVRGGQIPVLSGFRLGGDRSITITDPMMFGANGPLEGDNVGNFGIAGLERGMEFGYTHILPTGLFDGKLSWLNGVDETGAGDIPLAGHRANDFALQGDYLIGDEGSSVGAFYYHGRTPMLTAGFNDKFWRTAVFGNYTFPLQAGEPGIPKLALDVNGALLWGKDTLDATGASAKSRGNVVELDLYHNNREALIARYDMVKPTDVAGSEMDVTTKAFTLAAAQLPNPYFRWELEYRNQKDPGAHSLIASFWFFY